MKHPFIFKSLTITQNIALIIYTLLILVKCQTTNSHNFKKPEYYKYSCPDLSHEVLIQKESNIFMYDYYVSEYKDSRIIHKTQYHFSAHRKIEKKDCHIKWYDTYAEIEIPNDKNKIEQFDVFFENNSHIR